MKIKDFLKKQDGFSGADIAISIVIIMITVNVIIMIYGSFITNVKNIENKTIASRIAINVAENIDMLYFENFEKIYSELNVNENGEYVFQGGENRIIFNTSIPKGYTLILLISQDEKNEKIVNVNVKVRYIFNQKEEEFSVDKVLIKEPKNEISNEE